MKHKDWSILGYLSVKVSPPPLRKELSFLCTALLLIEIYPCTKFKVDIKNTFYAPDKIVGQMETITISQVAFSVVDKKRIPIFFDLVFTSKSNGS